MDWRTMVSVISSRDGLSLSLGTTFLLAATVQRYRQRFS